MRGNIKPGQTWKHSNGLRVRVKVVRDTEVIIAWLHPIRDTIRWDKSEFLEHFTRDESYDVAKVLNKYEV